MFAEPPLTGVSDHHDIELQDIPRAYQNFKAMAQMNLSVRAFQRALMIARTIAGLDGSDQIWPAHLAQAAC